ncbi:unnamed protein product [Scytosiphon promiscuus]
MEGRLKHKLLGDDGVLYWKCRDFVLRSRARAFEITDDQSSGYDGASLPVASRDGRSHYRDNGCGRKCVNHVSLEGARCAVAWSGIDAFNGCGFDLVWAGGRTWSLLCEDPLSRKSWVDAINMSIASLDDTSENVDQTSSGAGGRRRPYHAPAALSRTATNDSFTSSSRPSVGAGAPAPSSPQPRPANGCHDHHRRFGRDADRVELAAAKDSGRAEKAAVGRASVREERGKPSDGSSRDCRRVAPGYPPLGSGDGAAPPEVGRPPHQQQRHRPQGGTRRRRQRREEVAPDAERLERVCSGTIDQGSESDLSPMSGSGKKAVGERERSSRTDGVSGAEGEAPSGGGGRRAGSTRERSEELAKASAATWEQFQELLERSRESKARFDRAMGEASVSTSSGGASATSAPGLPPSSRRRAHARIGPPRETPGGAGVARREPGIETPSANSGNVGSRCVPLVEAPATTSATPSSQKGSQLDGSLGGSATDRVSDVSTPRSTPRQEHLPARCDATARLCDDGHWETSSEAEMDVAALGGSGAGDADATADHEHSRLSAGVTDVETSLLPEEGGEGGSSSGGGNGASGAESQRLEAGRCIEGGREGRKREARGRAAEGGTGEGARCGQFKRRVVFCVFVPTVGVRFARGGVEGDISFAFRVVRGALWLECCRRDGMNRYIRASSSR